MNLTSHTLRAIAKAEDGESSLPNDVFLIEGWSSQRVRMLLSNVTAFDGCRYLEVGCWKGSTLISALFGKDIKYWAIDNWCIQSRGDFFNNFTGFMGKEPNIIEGDCWSVDVPTSGISDVNCYFYDGGHEEIDQEMALTHYIGAMSNEFIFIVDDWNFPWVESGTMKAVKDLGLTVLLSVVLPSFAVNDSNSWWNGLWVAVLRKP